MPKSNYLEFLYFNFILIINFYKPWEEDQQDATDTSRVRPTPSQDTTDLALTPN